MTAYILKKIQKLNIQAYCLQSSMLGEMKGCEMTKPVSYPCPQGVKSGR